MLKIIIAPALKTCLTTVRDSYFQQLPLQGVPAKVIKYSNNSFLPVSLAQRDLLIVFLSSGKLFIQKNLARFSCA
jgi:hypothetical protein